MSQHLPAIRTIELTPLERELVARVRAHRQTIELLLGTVEMFHGLILPRADARYNGMAEHTHELERQLRYARQENGQLREAVMFARYEIGEVRRGALAADDHLRRAVSGCPDEDDPLNWIC